MSADGRKLLRLEVRNAETPIERKPEWIKTVAKMGPEYRQLQSLVKSEDLHTVCQEAGCPNIFECWEDREATFLIGGSQCTRRCDFCQIDTGKPADYDTDEPRRVAEGVTMHGFAINCDNSFEAYDAIVACGIRDAGITSISRVLGHTVTTSQVAPLVERAFTRAMAAA